MNKQNAIQAAVASVLLLGGAFVIWISIIRPQLDASSRGQLEVAQRQLIELRAELAQAEESENELDEFNTNREEARAETQTLQIEGRVLKSENDTLTREAESLQRNVRAISRDILIKADQREKLQTANELLTERLANQRTAFARLGESFLEQVERFKVGREKLLAGEKVVEEARLDFQDGLDDLAFEFKKLSSRNVGRIRTRYNVLSRERNFQAEDLGKKEVKLDLGEDDSEQTSDRIRIYVSVFGVIGKTARVMFEENRQEAAVRAQELLQQAGLIVDAQLATEVDLEAQKGRIFFFIDENEASADQLASIILEGEVGDYDVELLDDESTHDFVIWVIGEAPESEGGDGDGADGPNGDLPPDTEDGSPPGDGPDSDDGPPGDAEPGDAEPDGDSLPPEGPDGDIRPPEADPDTDIPATDSEDQAPPSGDAPPLTGPAGEDSFERELERELEQDDPDAKPAADGDGPPPEATFSQ